MHILIPCKGIRIGKTRLSDCLQPREHRALCEYLVAHTLEIATGLAGAGRVRIVTSDDEAVAIAGGRAVRSLPETGLGLNADLEAARDRLLAELSKPDDILILPIDLPFADGDALATMAACSGDLALAPDEARGGTNVLLLRPAAFRDFRFAYGADSFTVHVATAQRLGLSVEVIDDDRLSFDIDEPTHYRRWLRRACLAADQAVTLCQ